ncbi:MAG: hypothetical protein J0I47_00590 [Sphingomonas sp.]|uniref:putative 2OG-Fe(II) oxygenase n=1 Tax=Sphingomonas sp. TaxID=28214 RepID=UPI001AC23B0B|nr:putative 2OG-Fe(II) oxygenase [Sphingomonas sp.]MBN8806726.1 hypothetical protein [Sphingomonas sp.]
MSFAAALSQARRMPFDVATLEWLAETALAEDGEIDALTLVERAAEAGNDARLWQWTGLLYRSLADHRRAIAAFKRATMAAPDDPLIARGSAQVALEAGIPAVASFDRALQLAPLSDDAVFGLAAARLASGDGSGAMAGLAAVVSAHPTWTSGHERLSQLRWMLGDRTAATTSFDEALAQLPDNIPLWQTLIAILSRSRQFDAALTAIARARFRIGAAPFLDAYEAVAASELGDEAKGDRLFARLAESADPMLAVHRVRHLLRFRRVDEAATLIEPRLVAEDPLLWPYAAIVWRLNGDPRIAWLEQPALVSVIDLADVLPPLDELADHLTALHRATDRHLDQSVRGGTQTDGDLLLRIDPLIVALRMAILDAVKDHLDKLPVGDGRHPILMHRRDRPIRLAGSWSVRLAGAGFHDSHIHPAGWFSSALYIALPDAVTRGEDNSGWLALGAPPREFANDLGPSRLIEPKPGRLVLFPSTMWHATLPFADGERLTVAFDVARPRP